MATQGSPLVDVNVIGPPVQAVAGIPIGALLDVDVVATVQAIVPRAHPGPDLATHRMRKEVMYGKVHRPAGPRLERRSSDSDSANNRVPVDAGGGSYMMGRQDRLRPRFANERSIITSIVTRIAIDVAAVPIRHVRVDADGRYLEDIISGLDQCLTVEANLDQAARHFRQDVVQSLLDEGVIAVVPVDTTLSPETSGGYDIRTMRVGRITDWRPRFVRVSIYDESRGVREDITLPKRTVAIIENPLYSVMNEPNSTLQRLLQKLHLLDEMDNQTAAGKLDLIIQLPYVIKTEARRQQAEQRMKDIEFQLSATSTASPIPMAAEKVVQLNRSVENNLLPQVDEAQGAALR
jgi:hypothetical protein